MSYQIANQGGLASIREESKMSEEEGASEGVQREQQNEGSKSQPQTVLDYQELASFSKYKTGEEGNQYERQVYEKYLKALGRREKSIAERKAVLANIQKQRWEKARLEEELKRIVEEKAAKARVKKQKNEKELEHLKEEIALQQQFKQSLKEQLKTLESLTDTLQQNLEQFPSEKLQEACDMMEGEKGGWQISGRKILLELDLQQCLLSNIQKLIGEFPD